MYKEDGFKTANHGIRSSLIMQQLGLYTGPGEIDFLVLI
jgi:hypothetical protein